MPAILDQRLRSQTKSPLASDRSKRFAGSSWMDWCTRCSSYHGTNEAETRGYAPGIGIVRQQTMRIPWSSKRNPSRHLSPTSSSLPSVPSRSSLSRSQEDPQGRRSIALASRDLIRVTSSRSKRGTKRRWKADVRRRHARTTRRARILPFDPFLSIETLFPFRKGTPIGFARVRDSSTPHPRSKLNAWVNRTKGRASLRGTGGGVPLPPAVNPNVKLRSRGGGAFRISRRRTELTPSVSADDGEALDDAGRASGRRRTFRRDRESLRTSPGSVPRIPPRFREEMRVAAGLSWIEARRRGFHRVAEFHRIRGGVHGNVLQKVRGCSVESEVHEGGISLLSPRCSIEGRSNTCRRISEGCGKRGHGMRSHDREVLRRQGDRA